MSIMTQKDADIVHLALSRARMSTYESVAVEQGKSALALYAWNGLISGALLTPLQMCEVIIRNAVSDALEALYGSDWPWNKTFETSLPFARKKELLEARKDATTVGQVIPELSFYFWQNMFTSRHYGRIWEGHIDRLFPNMELGMNKQAKRIFIQNEMEHIRALRNRIAHHEHIFKRDLEDDYQRIVQLIGLRCKISAQWLIQNNFFNTVFGLKP